MKVERGMVAVVTGARSGVGFALAGCSGQAGLDVVPADLDDSAP